MFRRFSFLFALISWAPAAVLAAQVAPCETINWLPNRIYVINAQLHHATHIILPEPMSGQPVSGNPDLWAVDGQSTHMFVKPTNADSPEGGGSTVTVIGQSNMSYDFEVRRVRSGADLCVRIVKEGGLIDEKTQWRSGEERRVEQLQGQVTTLQSQLSALREAADKKALDSLHEYRGRVYTGYEWDNTKGFIGDDVIADVWDDGRFTYTRVKSDNKGLMQMTAKVDGKDELIQYDYDASKKLYTISGLYPEFTMHYAKSKVKVRRKQESS